MLFEYHSACMRDVSTHRVLVTEHVIRVLGLGNCNIHNEIPSFALKYLNTVYDKRTCGSRALRFMNQKISREKCVVSVH
ncbi:uncharacterized protein LOC143183915 isoform X8 [Calliopsis andreniformis]|uniref:uncharacterized protein LOC143183915 isoform X8 n=1 Tax=Calliopsis andreniformis TaxID=337506 RepID=UPI003FCEC66F